MMKEASPPRNSNHFVQLINLSQANMLDMRRNKCADFLRKIAAAVCAYPVDSTWLSDSLADLRLGQAV